MTCKEFQARLSELIDNELPDAQETEMYAHAEACEACDRLLRQTMQVVAGLNELPSSVPVPLEVQAAWRRAIRREPAERRRRGLERFSRAAAGVAAALLVLCGATWMSRMSPAAPVSTDGRGPQVETAAYTASGDEGAQAAYDASSAQQRVYGRMSDGALKKEDDATAVPQQEPTPLVSTSETTLRLARSAQLQIETQDFAADCRTLENIVSGSEGYFELREEQQAASLRATVRVPVEGLDDFLSQMEMVGHTVKRVEQARDLSGEYRDMEARLRVSQEKLEKLYEMQRECQDVNDLVTIAESITEELTENERLQGNEKQLNMQAGYASVEIELAETIAPSGEEAAAQSVSARISTGFSQSLEWLKSFCVDAFVLLVSSLPRLAVALPALALVLLIVHFIRKRRRY